MTHSGDLSTSDSLLVRVQLRDPLAWQRFVEVYGPMVYGWLRRCDLQPSDAADVSQEVFQAVARRIESFRREKEGDSFRGWLWTVTRNKVRDFLRHSQRQGDAIGGSAIQQRLLAEPDSTSMDSLDVPVSDDQHRALRAVLASLEPQFEPQSWRAFWQITVEGRAAADVAQDQQMSVTAVRQAKYRVLRRLRREMEDLA